jgi:hypothetical protein
VAWGVGSNDTNCTIVNNVVGQGSGGGIAHYSGSATVYNTIFYGNECPDSSFDFLFSQFTPTFQYNASEQTNGGGTNIDLSTLSPGFVDPEDDFRLTCDSPCLNAGNTSAAESDEHDVDEDGNTGELARDLGFGFRGIGAVDIGCFEKPLGAACTPTDIDEPPCGDGNTDIDDLLLVINSWGTCPEHEPCYADITATVGTVDIDDLLAVINGWGSCEGGSAQMPTSISDCWEQATAKGMTPHSQEWNEAVTGCIEALCVAEIIECDD